MYLKTERMSWLVIRCVIENQKNTYHILEKKVSDGKLRLTLYEISPNRDSIIMRMHVFNIF